MSEPTFEPSSPVGVLEPDETVDVERPWVVLVWNDPINLMPYVTFVLRKLFGYSESKAHALMLEVHLNGRAAVSSGSMMSAAQLAAMHPAGRVGASFAVQPFSAEFIERYWLHFELTSVLLLAAVVAAIAVIKAGRRHDG